MTDEAFGNYIDGKWMPAASGKTFENHNPADTSDLVGRFADSDPGDLERAVASALEAFPRWRATPAPKRGEILYRAAELLGLTRFQLYTRLKRYHIEVSPE
jgi:aldehyde dehydrogenase (NAD+)